MKVYAFYTASRWKKFLCRVFGHVPWQHAQPMSIWEKVFCPRCGVMAYCGNCILGVLHEAYDYGFVIETPTVEQLYMDHGGEA